MMPVNTHLLRLSMSVSEYLENVRHSPKKLTGDAFPVFKVARCPYCDTDYTTYLDLHSLWNCWNIQGLGTRVGWPVQRCEHYVGESAFVDLHHQRPSELKLWSNDASEVPCVIPECLENPDEGGEPSPIPSRMAVFHALPICRIEYEQFVPRYSAYIITYYARSQAAELHRYVFGGLLSGWGEYRPDREKLELFQWVERGQLLWLDPGAAELPLRRAPHGFPYQFDGDTDPFGHAYRCGRPVRPFITPLLELIMPKSYYEPEKGVTRLI
jgi:hypothetical protein